MKKNDITGLGCPVSCRSCKSKKSSPKGGFMDSVGSLLTGDTGSKLPEGTAKNFGQKYNTLQKEGLDVGSGIKIGGAAQTKAAQSAQQSFSKPTLTSGPEKTIGGSSLSLDSLKNSSRRIKLGG